jgi:hypothetical protein
MRRRSDKNDSLGFVLEECGRCSRTFKQQLRQQCDGIESFGIASNVFIGVAAARRAPQLLQQDQATRGQGQGGGGVSNLYDLLGSLPLGSHAQIFFRRGGLNIFPEIKSIKRPCSRGHRESESIQGVASGRTRAAPVSVAFPIICFPMPHGGQISGSSWDRYRQRRVFLREFPKSFFALGPALPSQKKTPRN